MSDTAQIRLETWFNQARQELDGDDLTRKVMSVTRRRKLKILAAAGLAGILLLTAVWLAFGMPLIQFAFLVSGYLTAPLVELEEGWLALALLPVNNVASVLIVSVKLFFLARKRSLKSLVTGF